MTPDPRPQAAAGPGPERLQALLARAADEQLSEQRQVSALLADLRALVVDLGQGLAGVEARLSRVQAQVDELSVRVDATAGAVTAALTGPLQQEVRAAVADSERRIAAHVDEAVLALAGVLLRRAGGPRGGAAPPAAVTGQRPDARAPDGHPAAEDRGASG